MKLSQLVAYLNHLDSFAPGRAIDEIHQHIDPVMHTIENHHLQFPDIGAKLENYRNNIKNSIHNIEYTIQDLRKEIKRNIESMESRYFSSSYALYQEMQSYDTVEYALDRRFTINSDDESYLLGRLMRYVDWHHPAMVIRPGKEDWINHLVALDPIYLVDTDHQMMFPCLEKFPDVYRRRLRTYVITESTDEPMLDRLPNGQMAFVLVYNFFHYKPFELIKCYLKELYQCLKPGGTVAFTFNDCDRSGGVELAERNSMCYTPGVLVLSAAEMLGFKVTHTYQLNSAATWVEITKPGNLISLRGGQALAKIMPRVGSEQEQERKKLSKMEKRLLKQEKL